MTAGRKQLHGQAFEIILHYLRAKGNGQSFILPPLGKSQLEQLRNEAQFYGVRSMFPLIDEGKSSPVSGESAVELLEFDFQGLMIWNKFQYSKNAGLGWINIINIWSIIGLSSRAPALGR